MSLSRSPVIYLLLVGVMWKQWNPETSERGTYVKLLLTDSMEELLRSPKGPNKLDHHENGANKITHRIADLRIREE